MRRPYGAVNPLTILTIVAVIGAAYWAICFLPKIIDNLDIKEATDVAISSARFSDESIVKTITLKSALVGSHREEDESGQFVEVPGLNLTEENITIDRDENAKTVTVTVRYTRDVKLIPFGKWTTMSFTIEKTGSTAL